MTCFIYTLFSTQGIFHYLIMSDTMIVAIALFEQLEEL